jgi:hypothetical protein
MKILEDSREFYDYLSSALESFNKKKIFLFATHHPNNIPSGKALKKSGFNTFSEEIFNIKKYKKAFDANQGDRIFVIKDINEKFIFYRSDL